MSCINVQQVPIISSMQQTRKPYVFSDLHNDVMKENIPVWISIVDRIKDRGT